MIVKYNSNNCIKVNSIEYVSKYHIVNNDYKLYSLLEYNKDLNDYKVVFSSFNVYSFIEKIKPVKKYFSFKIEELIKD